MHLLRHSLLLKRQRMREVIVFFVLCCEFSLSHLLVLFMFGEFDL